MTSETLDSQKATGGLDSSVATPVFQAVVRERHSARGFLPEPIDDGTLQELFADAMTAPSNCNTQPWEVHVVSGQARDRMVAALLDAAATTEPHPDFSFDVRAYTGRFSERQQAQGASYHQALGIKREDWEARQGVSSDNLKFFGAPHAAFLFMPEVGDSVRVAGDVGMFAQTFLLALAARGLSGVPQTSLARFPNTVREQLGLPPALKLLFGISFGRPDVNSPTYAYRIGRDPVDSQVTLHRA
jgi:nitroreductase